MSPEVAQSSEGAADEPPHPHGVHISEVRISENEINLLPSTAYTRGSLQARFGFYTSTMLHGPQGGIESRIDSIIRLGP